MNSDWDECKHKYISDRGLGCNLDIGTTHANKSHLKKKHNFSITVYQYGKNVLYLFYNIAQRNIKKKIFRRFRVDIELYQHGS
jgi:hypothetical protein